MVHFINFILFLLFLLLSYFYMFTTQKVISVLVVERAEGFVIYLEEMDLRVSSVLLSLMNDDDDDFICSLYIFFVISHLSFFILNHFLLLVLYHSPFTPTHPFYSHFLYVLRERRRDRDATSRGDRRFTVAAHISRRLPMHLHSQRPSSRGPPSVPNLVVRRC